MNTKIEINVENKIASAAEKSAFIVCGNSDYLIKFSFDEEWAEHEVKTARFAYAGKYIDIVFSGDECPVPIITDTVAVGIGVFAGDLKTTTPAIIACERSILCGGGTPAEPPEDVYNQIMDMLGDVATALDKINGEVI